MPVVTTNLVYYWNGKDGIKTGNTLRNLSPNGAVKNLQITGGTPLANGAISLNGTTDFAQFPATESMFTTSASPYTMELIYTPRVFSGDHAIWEGGLFLGTFTWGKLYWEFARNTSGNTAGQANTVAVMNTASPLRMAVVYNGTSAQVYVNGTSVGTVGAGSAHAFSAGGYTTVSIAGGVSGLPNYRVDLHAIRVYNRALTTAELTTNWNEGIEIGLVVQDTTPPAEVPTLSETHTYNSITLQWTKPSDADFSHVRILKNGTQVATNQTGTAFTDNKVSPNTTYTYLVKTVDTTGNESAGRSITVTTSPLPDTTPPAVVSNLTETHTHNSVTLNWTNPTDPDFSHVVVLRDGAEIAVGLAGETYTDSNLPSETDFVYAIYTMDTSGNDSADATINVRTDALPDLIPPKVRILGATRFKISDEVGMDTAKVSFSFDKGVTEWRVNVLGVDPFTGVLADSGGAVEADTPIEAVITWNELYQEGDNRINIYGKNSSGIWTDYQTYLTVDGGTFLNVIFENVYSGKGFDDWQPTRTIDGGNFT